MILPSILNNKQPFRFCVALVLAHWIPKLIMCPLSKCESKIFFSTCWGEKSYLYNSTALYYFIVIIGDILKAFFWKLFFLPSFLIYLNWLPACVRGSVEIKKSFMLTWAGQWSSSERGAWAGPPFPCCGLWSSLFPHYYIEISHMVILLSPLTKEGRMPLWDTLYPPPLG